MLSASKKNKLILLVSIFLIVGFFSKAVFAQTTSSAADLQAIVKQLQDQIKELQAKIAELRTQAEELKAEIQFTKTLLRGMIGEEVTKLQEFLKQQPNIYPEGLVTGYFGSLTESAVKRWQEQHGIEPVGIVGPITRSRLNELVSGGTGVFSFTSPISASVPVLFPATTTSAGVNPSPSISTSAPTQTTTPTSPTTTTTATSTTPNTTSTTPAPPPSPPPTVTTYPVCGQSVKRVPQEYSSVQAAVDAASPGDTIQIAAGTYNGGVFLNQYHSGICLEGAGVDQTIITKSGGVGIYIDNGSYLIVKDLTVKNSGGVLTDPGGFGILSGSNIKLSSCRLTQNIGTNGAGLNIRSGTNIAMDHCLIDNNRAKNIGGGIMIDSYSSAVSFTNVTVTNNIGGDNSLQNGGVGGIAFYSFNNTQVTNSIIWGNSNPDIRLSSLAIVTISYSDVAGWSGFAQHDINVNPVFVSSSDYHLQSTSPAINAGDPDPKYNDPDGTRNDMGAFPTTQTPSSTTPPSSTPSADTTVPSAPSGLTATPASSQINLSWTVSTDNVGVTGYKVYRNGTQIATTTSISYQDTGLSPATYVYTIQAYDAAGNNSSQSVSVSAVILDNTPPSSILGLSATPVSASQINLSWNASTDNIGVTGYKVFRNDVQIGATANTSYSDNGLTASTFYYYQVSAYDATGNNSELPIAVAASTYKFSLGDIVVTTTNGNTDIYSGPSLSATVVGSQHKDRQGTIIEGPVGSASGHTWWRVDFNQAPDGWVTEGSLASFAYNGSTSQLAAMLEVLRSLLSTLQELQRSLGI